MQTYPHNSIPPRRQRHVRMIPPLTKGRTQGLPYRTNWMVYLLFVLFCIRVSIKEHIGYTPAELLYDTTLTLPGQMVAPISPHNVPDPMIYVHHLREFMSRPLHTHPRPQSVKTHVPLDINQWSHVFVCNDRVSTRLRPPYSGPYQVLRRQGTPKYTPTTH